MALIATARATTRARAQALWDAMQNGTRTLPVTIIRDPGVRRERFCAALLRVLVAFIRETFRCPVAVRAPRTLAADFALMVHAGAFISSVSSFGMFAGIASYGTAYLPVSHQGAGSTGPCFPNLRWWLGPMYTGYGATPAERARRAIDALPDWFAPAQADLVNRTLESVEVGTES